MAKLMDVFPFHAAKFEGDASDCGANIGYFKIICAYTNGLKKISGDVRISV